MKRHLAVLSVVMLTWSCAKPPMSPSSGQSVTVAVSDKTSKVSLAGVDVKVSFLVTSARSSGSGSSVSFSSSSLFESGKTGTNGMYTWASIPDNVSSATITVEGTGDYAGVVRDVRLHAGDTRFDIELDRRSRYTLSGTVFESTPDGSAAIEGVQLRAYSYLDCNSCADLSGTTDRNGHYSIPGMWADHEAAIYIFKNGYTVTDPPGLNECEGCDRRVTAAADTQLDIPLVRQ